MKKIASLLGALLFCVTGLHAQDLHDAGTVNPNITPFHDARDAAMGYSSAALQNQAAWKQFVQHHPGWGAQFDRNTRLPHRAIGAPIPFASGGADPVVKAMAFLQQEFAGFNLPLQDLQLSRSYNDGKYIHVDFKQVHQNQDVLWSRVGIRFTQDLRIMMVILDAYRDIPALTSTLSASDAKLAAEQAITTTITNTTVDNTLRIFPYPAESGCEYHLVYTVHVFTKNDNKTPGNYLTYVDANSGEILYRQNEVKFFDVKLKGDVYPTNQYTPTQNRVMRNMKVKVGSTTYYTDSNGVATLPSGPANATISLEGKWVKVIDAAGSATASASYTHTFNNSGDSSTFDITVPHANDRGVNVYYHVNVVHDFMKTKYPSFTTMDNALPANVDVTGTCNAYYSGTDINFYAAGGGCNAFSYIGDVMSHEYGHGISDKFYTWQGGSFDNGAMGEGYSDTWANCILKTGIIGAGDNSPTSYIRRYDIVHKIYPQDLVGEVHADGEIIAGAWWDVGVNWNSVDSMGDLFAASYYGLATGPNGTEGQVYHDILIDALTYDDDNGNITDGTPHFAYIVTAFAAHGIYLLTNTTMQHAPPATIAAGTPYTINTNAISDFPAFLGDVRMIYRIKGSTAYDTILMTKSGSNYTCQFPSATAGTVYEYIFALYDFSNVLSVFAPLNAAFTNGSTKRNVPYYLLVGYTSYFNEPFDTISSSTPGWTIGNATNDNATAGKWIVGVPVASLTNGDTVQTGHDHTTGSGKCGVTGNASSATSPATSADVDGGRTSLITETYDLSKYNQPVLSYWRWFSNSQSATNPGKDYWRVWVSYDNGNTFATMIEKTTKPDVSWRRFVYIPDLSKGSSIKLMFVATDTTYTGVNGTLVEAAVDDIEILAMGTSTGVNEWHSLDARVYPNPVTDNLTISVPESGSLQYSLINALGEVLHQERAEVEAGRTIRMQTASYPDGLYYLKLDMNGKQAVHKIQVIH